jgi:hypothetical protein
VFSEIKPAGESGRPKGGGLTDRQLRAAQALRDHASKTGQWTFTTDEFERICINAGAITATAANSRRARASDLKVQLANRRLINVNDNQIRLAGTA